MPPNSLSVVVDMIGFCFTSIQDGVLIDFSQMKAFSYNEDLDSITLEPGVRWGEVCGGLQAQGVSPVGGRVLSASIYFLFGHHT